MNDLDIDKIIKEVFNNEYGDNEFSDKLFLNVRGELSQAVSDGYSKKTAYDLKDAQMVLQLQNNVAVLAAFKSFRQTGEMKVALVNEDGSKKTWSNFLKESKSIDDKYRTQWLKAEYELANKQARAAERWQQFLRDENVYPNLEFLASTSVEKNQDHTKYYGLIFPLNHLFWNTGLPPLKYGCKCGVKQTRGNVSDTSIEPPVPQKGIAGNAGKTGQVFSSNHPYVFGLSKEEKDAVKMQFYEFKKSFDTDYFTIKGKKGKVDVSLNADVNDLKDNFNSARLVADKFKGSMIILPHSEGRKNPEYMWNKTVGDKSTQSSKNVSNYIRNTFKKVEGDGQLSDLTTKFLYFEFTDLEKASAVSAARMLNGKLNKNSGKGIEFIFLQKDKKLIQIEASDFNYDSILSKISNGLI